MKPVSRGSRDHQQPGAKILEKSFTSHDQVNYRLAIRNLICASGLLDDQGYVKLAPTHLEIFRAATRGQPSAIPPKVGPPWNARHNGGIVSLLVRCVVGIENGLVGTWNRLATKRNSSPTAAWDTIELIRLRAEALEELAPDLASGGTSGVRRRADAFADGRERWKLTVSVVNLTRERLGMEALETVVAPTMPVTREASQTGLYVCVARTPAVFPGIVRASRDAKDLWTCKTIGSSIPGDIGEALDSVSQLVRYDLSGCGIAKYRPPRAKAVRWTTVLPRELLVRGTKERDQSDVIVSKLAEALEQIGGCKDAAARQDDRRYVSVAYLWRNQREELWPGIVARELEALWQWRDSFDDETKLEGLSRKDWMIGYKAKLAEAAKKNEPRHRLDAHEVWARNWRGARRLA